MKLDKIGEGLEMTAAFISDLESVIKQCCGLEKLSPEVAEHLGIGENEMTDKELLELAAKAAGEMK